MRHSRKKIDLAYFSMEMMLESDIPSFAGGLGVLAGDLLRSMADMKVPAVGMSLVYGGTAFDQIIHPDGTQEFDPVDWRKLDQLTKLPDQITITLKNTPIHVYCWRYDMIGIDRHVVPVFLLDTNWRENPPWAREITQNLYDQRPDIRICQELVLGVGGIHMLRALGYENVETYHLNEGHSSFATLALLAECDWKDDLVRKQCVFTTHTPIPEGHDYFDYSLAFECGETYLPWHIKDLATEGSLSMTHLGLSLSKSRLAVSKKHRKVTQHLFPQYTIGSVTNGVHHRSWIAPEMQNVLEKYIPGYLRDPKLLKKVTQVVPDQDIWDAHMESKQELISYVNRHLTSVSNYDEQKNPPPEELFDADVLTIALARRPVAYKRPLLLYRDLERLSSIGKDKIQIIQCGKSHPTDHVSQEIVHQIVQTSKKMRGEVKIVYLENYSPQIARFLVAGCDVWLNTPMQPLEASGTSGMKAAMNGVLNFSIPDGWWIEGYALDPDAGFCIGEEIDTVVAQSDDEKDANALYSTLESHILPIFYKNRVEWIRRMKHAIALGSYFNTNRCVEEYKNTAWKAESIENQITSP